MRLATIVLLALVACNDVRDFHGSWHGPRVGDAPVLRLGVSVDATATLSIEHIDDHGARGVLSIDGLVAQAAFTTVDGAEADVLAGMSFDGSPLRVYLSFVPIPDGHGDALAVISLYHDHRIQVRILRGGDLPLYSIFALTEGS